MSIGVTHPIQATSIDPRLKIRDQLFLLLLVSHCSLALLLKLFHLKFLWPNVLERFTNLQLAELKRETLTHVLRKDHYSLNITLNTLIS